MAATATAPQVLDAQGIALSEGSAVHIREADGSTTYGIYLRRGPGGRAVVVVGHDITGGTLRHVRLCDVEHTIRAIVPGLAEWIITHHDLGDDADPLAAVVVGPLTHDQAREHLDRWNTHADNDPRADVRAYVYGHYMRRATRAELAALHG